jgi:hypothetical protein
MMLTTTNVKDNIGSTSETEWLYNPFVNLECRPPTRADKSVAAYYMSSNLMIDINARRSFINYSTLLDVVVSMIYEIVVTSVSYVSAAGCSSSEKSDPLSKERSITGFGGINLRKSP